MTQAAIDAIEKSGIIIGYKTYLEFIRELIKHKEIIDSGMRQEVDRSKKAVELAMHGKSVAVISGGDSGIYGMAGLILEICLEQGLKIKDKEGFIKDYDIKVDIIPGIPAFVAASSLLGAPLMHDFASISLSDLLTPWETIEKKVKNAAEADFIIAVYNPKSIKRDWQLKKAIEIISAYRDFLTPVGVVKKAMRPAQEIIITTLSEVINIDIDMQTVIIIGNSQTYVYDNHVITPRGYQNKYEY